MLAKHDLAPAEYRTGIPAIEAMSDEYIDKYNLPNRINRAYDALMKAIKDSSDEQALIKALDLDEKGLAQVNEVLDNLRNSEHLKAEAKGKIDTLLNNDEILYPSDIINEIREKEADIREMLRKFGNEFQGRADKHVGKTRLACLEEEVKFKSETFINIFKNLVEQTQKTSKAKLQNIFEEFNNSLFSGKAFENMPLPVLEGLKHKMSNLEFSLSSNEIEKEEKSKKVKIGTVKWFSTLKVWKWGDDVYETRYWTEEFVILEDLYKTRDDKIRQYFGDLIRSTIEKIQIDTKHYLEQFKHFIEEEYIIAIEKIAEDLQAKSSNKANLEKQIDEAKRKLDQINEFKAKLDKIISL